MTKAIATQGFANLADAVASLPFLTGRHKLTVALGLVVGQPPCPNVRTRPPLRKLPPRDNNFPDGGKGGL